MEATTIRWLHISDLHMGCRGKEVWWQVRSEFKESIRKHFQPIDMILVTGDLTFSAQPKEFELFNTFLDELLGWLHAAGQGADPLVIAVPGNHDLAWPAERQLRNFRVLENLWNDPDHPDLRCLCEEFWSEHRATFFDPLFDAYTSWFEKNILPRFTNHSSVRYHCSHFPGDLSVFLDLPDRPPVTVVGLNSAWVQYTNGDFDRRIELFTQLTLS
jgi:predicted MPP superfamily phosphohydrolase